MIFAALVLVLSQASCVAQQIAFTQSLADKVSTVWQNDTIYALADGTPEQLTKATELAFTNLNITETKVIPDNGGFKVTGTDSNGRKVTVTTKLQANENTTDGPQFTIIHNDLGTNGYGIENLVSIYVETNKTQEYPLSIYNKIMWNVQSMKSLQYAT